MRAVADDYGNSYNSYNTCRSYGYSNYGYRGYGRYSYGAYRRYLIWPPVTATPWTGEVRGVAERL